MISEDPTLMTHCIYLENENIQWIVNTGAGEEGLSILTKHGRTNSHKWEGWVLKVLRGQEFSSTGLLFSAWEENVPADADTSVMNVVSQ